MIVLKVLVSELYDKCFFENILSVDIFKELIMFNESWVMIWNDLKGVLFLVGCNIVLYFVGMGF